MYVLCLFLTMALTRRIRSTAQGHGDGRRRPVHGCAAGFVGVSAAVGPAAGAAGAGWFRRLLILSSLCRRKAESGYGRPVELAA
jgi:hypothetical protein